MQNPIKFTDEEIAFMKKTVTYPPALKYQKGSDIWIKAFKLYNSKNKRRLSMVCMPCFGKVLHYCIQYHLDMQKPKTVFEGEEKNDLYSTPEDQPCEEVFHDDDKVEKSTRYNEIEEDDGA